MVDSIVLSQVAREEGFRQRVAYFLMRIEGRVDVIWPEFVKAVI